MMIWRWGVTRPLHYFCPVTFVRSNPSMYPAEVRRGRENRAAYLLLIGGGLRVILSDRGGEVAGGGELQDGTRNDPKTQF